MILLIFMNVNLINTDFTNNSFHSIINLVSQNKSLSSIHTEGIIVTLFHYVRFTKSFNLFYLNRRTFKC